MKSIEQTIRNKISHKAGVNKNKLDTPSTNWTSQGRVGIHDQFSVPFTMMECILNIATFLAYKLEKKKDDTGKGEQC